MSTENLPNHPISAADFVRKVEHWHQDFEITPGLWTGGSYKPHRWLEWMQLPVDMTGIRVLEVGSCDGFFTLEMARRNATVVAIDYQAKDKTGFWVTEGLSGMKVDFRQLNIYQLPGAGLGQFDLVLCLGVIYHLPDPYKALTLFASHCKVGGKVVIETVAALVPDTDVPVMRFYKNRSLDNDLTNFWAQSPRCLEEMAADVGFGVLRTEVLPSGGKETTRMILEGIRVENEEAAYRIDMAYGMRG